MFVLKQEQMHFRGRQDFLFFSSFLRLFSFFNECDKKSEGIQSRSKSYPQNTNTPKYH